MRRYGNRGSPPLPLFAGEVGAQSVTGEGVTRGTTLTLGASHLDLSHFVGEV